MEQIPDAPYIREAEQFGMPSAEYPDCPVCGRECRLLFEDSYGEIVGCDNCVREIEADEWLEEQLISERLDAQERMGCCDD